MGYSPEKKRKLNRQLQHWEEEPPATIEEFICDPEYLNLGEQVCDAVLNTLTELFDPSKDYREAVLIWGIGAGKSFLVSLALCYQAYCLLCLKDPQDYYGLAPGSTISLCNFSVNATQARQVVFSEIRARVQNSKCFTRKGFVPDPKLDWQLKWSNKSILLQPGNSQDTSALGQNLFGAAIDEASWLPDVERSVRIAGRTSGGHFEAAEALYNTIVSRIASRGNYRWRRDSFLLMISSPRYVGDFMERMAGEAKENTYVSRLPAWEGIQKARLSGKTFEDAVLGQVPIEYAKEFRRNPELSRRDFGAQPSEAIEGFFADHEALEAVYDLGLESVFDETGRVPVVRADLTIASTLPRYAHIDLALKRDACGIAIAHGERDTIIFDALTYLEAADFGEEIDLEHVRNLLLGLRDAGMRFAEVTFDGWQSVDSRQLLKKRGIPTDLLSVDRTTEAYDTLKTFVYEHRVQVPDTGRSRRFTAEAKRLELVAGKKVDHPPRGSKDVADAAAGAVLNWSRHARAHSKGAAASTRTRRLIEV